jgi:two-component system chemotaxis response regulator CheB
MMRKIRVLIVDDSLVVRRLVMDELSLQPDIEVVGAAGSGRAALEKLSQLEPDLVILDIEMPEMDGLTALTEMRRTHPRLPIIMFSSLTELGAAATLDALSRGASDFFAKPRGSGGLDDSRQIIRAELLPAIRALCARGVDSDRIGAPAKSPTGSSRVGPGIADSIAPRRSTTIPAMAAASLASARLGRIELVAIGASTGGPNALADLFCALPSNFPVPLLVVQHMPPMFTRLLAERLTKISPIPTAEAESGLELTPGRALIAPGDHHLILRRDGVRIRTVINQDAPENSCRPAVDPLFRSVADLFGRHVLGVVLTGMGQDGLRGCESIRAASGQIIAQDEATSVVWGMPGAVARAGLADAVLPLPAIADEIVRRTRLGRA